MGGTAPPEQDAAAEAAATVAGLLCAVALALWFTAGVWGPSAPAGDDVAARLANTSFAIDHLFGEGQIDGWQPIFGVGYQQFLFLGPGLALVVAAVRWLSLGLLSVAGAFKVVTVGSFVALPLGVAFLARSFAFTRRSAGLAAILALGISGPLAGFGLHSLFAVGLITNQLGAVFFCLALGAVVRQLAGPRRRWILLGAVAGAALVVVHIVSALVLALVVAAVILLTGVERALPGVRPVAGREPERRIDRRGRRAGEQLYLFSVDRFDRRRAAEARRRQGLAGLGMAGALAFGLAAFMLVPLAAHRDLQGPYTGLGTPPLSEQLAGIADGAIVLAPGLAVWVVAGLAFAGGGAIWGRAHAFTLALVAPVCLVVAHAAYSRWPQSLVTAQLPTRSLGYLVLLALLPLASLLGWLARRSGLLGQLVAVAAAVVLVVTTVDNRSLATEAEPVPALFDAAAQLAALVPDGARFATQRDFPAEIAATGVSHPDFWLPWLSGRNTLNIFNAESSFARRPVFEPEGIGNAAPEATADALSRLGVTHVVLVNDEEPALVASPRFELVWRSPPLSILAVASPAGQPDPASLVSTPVPATATLIEARPGHLRIGIDAAALHQATIAVGWSPKWHARLDGRPAPLARTADGLLSLAVSAGAHTLELDFDLDVWDAVGQAASGSTIIVVALWVFRAQRRRRAAPPSGGPPEPPA